MKRWVKIVCMIMLFSFCLVQIAVAIEIRPMASDLITTATITITKVGSGKVTTKATVKSDGISDKLGFPSYCIQEKQGSSWVTVKTSNEDYTTNKNTYTSTLSYEGTAGKEYRARASFYVKAGSVTETRALKNSSTVTAS